MIKLRGPRFVLIKLFLMVLAVFLPLKLQAARKPQEKKELPVASAPVIVDALWQETLSAIAAENATDSLRLLRLCILGNVELPQAEKQLHLILASATVRLVAGRELIALNDSELLELLQIRREICSMKMAVADDWLLLLQAARSLPRSDNFIIHGQNFLDQLEKGFPLKLNASWIELLQALEVLLVKDEQVLYRLQLGKIFAAEETTRAKYQPRLADLQLLAEARAIKILGLAEVAIAVGELDSARAYLDKVRLFDPKYSGLDKLYRKLELSGRILKLVNEATDFFRNQKFDEAVKVSNEVLKIDGNNVFALNLLQQIEEARNRPVGNVATANDRLALRFRRVEADLRKAEKDQDYLQIRQCIRDILLLRSDMATYTSRLEEIEQEIALSRLHADDRLKEAEKLFVAEDFGKLRLFLNRNPGLMNSLERMVQVWEMRLLANYYTGFLDPVALKASAEELLKKSGRNFAASFVLMQLAIADNKIADARVHYLAARELNPVFPGLRVPGWLLWVHGEGRPVVVVILIIILFFLIKAIGPAFAWFESTYWLRIALLSRVFPSLALRSLEGCFGAFKDNRDRERLFRLLMKCSLACGNQQKAVRYAENLLEIIPADTAALAVLVPHWLNLAELNDEKMTTIVTHIASFADQPEVIEKTGRIIKRSKKIKTEQIEFFKLYISRFPEDVDMMQIIGKGLLEIPAAEMPDSAIAMIETAWRRTESDELWWSLWRLLMFCGRFDQAIQITHEVLEKGKKITPAALLEVYDRDIFADLRQVISLLSLFDEKKVVEAVKMVKRFRYLNPRMVEEVLQILEGLGREENVDLATRAREAADHVRVRGKASAAAIEKLMALLPAPREPVVEVSSVVVEEDEFSEPVVAAEIAQEDGAMTATEESGGHNFYSETSDDVAEVSFSSIMATADVNDDVISVGDLLAGAGFTASSGDVVLPSSEDIVDSPLASIEVAESSALSSEESGASNWEAQEKNLSESLQMDSEAVRIDETRRRLFAELDSYEAPETPSRFWKNGCEKPVGNNLYFSDL